MATILPLEDVRVVRVVGVSEYCLWLVNMLCALVGDPDTAQMCFRQLMYYGFLLWQNRLSLSSGCGDVVFVCKGGHTRWIEATLGVLCLFVPLVLPQKVIRVAGIRPYISSTIWWVCAIGVVGNAYSCLRRWVYACFGRLSGIRTAGAWLTLLLLLCKETAGLSMLLLLFKESAGLSLLLLCLRNLRVVVVAVV